MDQCDFLHMGVEQKKHCVADIKKGAIAMVEVLYDDVLWMFSEELDLRQPGKVLVLRAEPKSGDTVWLVHHLATGAEFHARYDEMRPLVS